MPIVLTCDLCDFHVSDKEEWKKQLEEILIHNEVLVYVVWKHEYYDDYKRGYSHSEPIECCYEKEYAYESAMRDNINYITNHCDNKNILEELKNIKCPIEQLRFIEDNFEDIYGKPEFTCEPSQTIWKVRELSIAI